MARVDGFIEQMHELLAPLGEVEVRRMFGGLGVYVDDVFIAVASDGRLYLKTDAESQPLFDAEGSEPFAFGKKGEVVTTSYWSAPDSAMESAERMARWAQMAIVAAKRKAAAKPAKGANAAPKKKATAAPKKKATATPKKKATAAPKKKATAAPKKKALAKRPKRAL